MASSAAPIVASGSFNGNGDATIVASPNAAGYGLPASIWTANDAQVESTTGGGTASLTSCYIGDFMRSSPGTRDLTDAKASCPQNGSAPPCHCPSSKDDSTSWLSGHPSGGNRRENLDILDRDSNACVAGNPCPPDIQFFPGAGYSDPTSMSGPMVALDAAGVNNDDSLFEWIFGVDNVVADHDTTGTTLTNCGAGSQNCADYALRETLGATVVSSCAGLNAASSGLYYVTGDCSFSGQIGSATAPAIIVTFGTGDIGSNGVLYGMLFVHRNNIKDATDAACPSGCAFSMNGGTVFGSVVIEGNIKFAGNPVIIYDDVGRVPIRILSRRMPSSRASRAAGSTAALASEVGTMKTFPNIRRNRGFSLLEVLVAVVILSFGLLALASLQFSLMRGSSGHQVHARATALAIRPRTGNMEPVAQLHSTHRRATQGTRDRGRVAATRPIGRRVIFQPRWRPCERVHLQRKGPSDGERHAERDSLTSSSSSMRQPRHRRHADVSRRRRLVENNDVSSAIKLITVAWTDAEGNPQRTWRHGRPRARPLSAAADGALIVASFLEIDHCPPPQDPGDHQAIRPLDYDGDPDRAWGGAAVNSAGGPSYPSSRR
jgi:prepilin-type N-terminal cleavage/methylation domain-containing protein